MNCLSTAIRNVIFLLVTAGTAATITGCSSQTYATPKPMGGLTSTQTTRLKNYFGDAGTNNDYQISSATLHQWLYRDHKRVFLLDTRQLSGPYGFSVGHIPGAVNVPIQDVGRLIASQPALGGRANSAYPILPKGIPIVVMCYDGDGGEQTPTLLRLLGYQAYGLQYGVSAWNDTLNVWLNPSVVVPLPVSKGNNGTLADLNKPTTGPDVVGPSLSNDVISYYGSMARSYPPGFTRPWTMNAGALYRALNSKSAPDIIDLRNPDAFALGHIPGSINIPFSLLGSNLTRLNPNKRLVLISPHLQRAAQACAALRLLGYDAWVLGEGLVSWNPQFGTVVSTNQYPLTTAPTKG